MAQERLGDVTRERGWLVWIGLLTVMASPLAAQATGGEEGQSTPTEVAEQFLKAFAEKDIDTVVSLFAPGARIQRARLSDAGPDYAQSEVEDWAVEARASIAGIEAFEIEILKSEAVAFEEGTTVSVLFRATGQVGEGATFVTNGVDSFSMTRMDGGWRILLYNSMEKLEF